MRKSALRSPFRKEYLEDELNNEAQAARNAIIERTARAALLDFDEDYPTLDHEQWLAQTKAHNVLQGEDVNIMLGYNQVKEGKKTSSLKRAKSSRGHRPRSSARARRNHGNTRRPKTSQATRAPSSRTSSPVSAATSRDDQASGDAGGRVSEVSDDLRRYIGPLQHKKLSIARDSDSDTDDRGPLSVKFARPWPLASPPPEPLYSGRVRVSQIDAAISSLEAFSREVVAFNETIASFPQYRFDTNVPIPEPVLSVLQIAGI